MDFTIRQAGIKDLLTLQKLNQALFISEAQMGHDDILDTTWPGSEAGKAYYTKLLTTTDRAVYLAENSAKQSLGYIAINSENKFSYRKIVTGEIENMYIIPSARRQGIGRKLMNTAKNWFKKNNIQRVYVSAYSKNINAIDYYKKMGFGEWETGLELKII